MKNEKKLLDNISSVLGVDLNSMTIVESDGVSDYSGYFPEGSFEGVEESDYSFKTKKEIDLPYPVELSINYRVVARVSSVIKNLLIERSISYGFSPSGKIEIWRTGSLKKESDVNPGVLRVFARTLHFLGVPGKEAEEFISRNLSAHEIAVEMSDDETH